ncbi:MAG: hypothetical protein RIR10_522, partial [Planctomycetota bacterium]
MRLTTFRADLLLLAAAVIWGSGFVAQKLGSEHLQAFAFTGLRFTLGTVLLLPLLAFAPWPTHIDRTKARRATLLGGLSAGLVMMLAANAQQHGIAGTTASNSAFITSLYVVFVPFIAIAVTRHRLGWRVWTGVAVAIIGLLLLGINRDFHINVGDPWVLLCALLWAFHVVIVGIYSKDAEPIRFSLIQLAMTGVGALVVAFSRDEITADNITRAKWALLYGACLPVAVAFTLQVVAQKKAPPTHTALILSLESVFGMICGIAFLGDRPTMQQYTGALLMLAGVVVSQLPQRKNGASVTTDSTQEIASDPQPR